MKKILITKSVRALWLASIMTILLPMFAVAQCEIKAYAVPKTVCEGQQVHFTSHGQCNYLMNNNFNNQTLGFGWSSTAANPVFTNPCGPGPDSWHAWVGTTASPIRTLETNNYNVSLGNCTVEFYMRYGLVQGSGPCEDPDLPSEGVHLQYSTNNGGSWADFPGPDIDPVGVNSVNPPYITNTPGSGGYWTPSSGIANQQNHSLYYWHKYSCPVPTAAISNNTKFRWAQLSNSSAGWDAWGIDEVEIACPDTNAIYTWTDPNGTVLGNVKNLGYYTPTITGWYYITIVDTATYDFAKDSVYITVNPIPTPEFTVSDSSICAGDDVTFTYTGNATPAATYNWLLESTPYTGQGPHVINFPSKGSYTMSLEVSEKSCNSNTKKITIVVNENPVISYGFDINEGCVPLEVSFSNGSTPSNASFLWDFGDGNTSTVSSPVHVYTQPGTYDVSLFGETAFGCEGEFTIPNLINAFPSPTAAFMAIPDVVSFSNPFVQFNDLSINPQFWQWDFDDPGSPDNTSTVQNPSHVFTTDGEFYVTLIVSTDKGCADTTQRKVIVVIDEIVVPNIITPNGDGRNDVFFIENIERLKQSRLIIYNRWGKKVYETDNYQNNWAAESNADGVYYWVLQYKTYFEEREESGTVTVLRNP